MTISYRVEVIPESEDVAVYHVTVLVDGEVVDERECGRRDEAEEWASIRMHELDGLPDDEDPDPSLPRM